VPSAFIECHFATCHVMSFVSFMVTYGHLCHSCLMSFMSHVIYVSCHSPLKSVISVHGIHVNSCYLWHSCPVSLNFFTNSVKFGQGEGQVEGQICLLRPKGPSTLAFFASVSPSAMAPSTNCFLCFYRAITFAIAREKQGKLLGGGAITNETTDAKNASVDGP
jgi:hypothetical protein